MSQGKKWLLLLLLLCVALGAPWLHSCAAQDFHNTYVDFGNSEDWHLLMVMRSLGLTYGLIVKCNQDSTDRELIKDLRKLALRTHLAREGSTTGQQRLNDARTAWENALQNKTSSAKPCAHESQRVGKSSRKNSRENAPLLPLSERGFQRLSHMFGGLHAY